MSSIYRPNCKASAIFVRWRFMLIISLIALTTILLPPSRERAALLCSCRCPGMRFGVDTMHLVCDALTMIVVQIVLCASMVDYAGAAHGSRIYASGGDCIVANRYHGKSGPLLSIYVCLYQSPLPDNSIYAIWTERELSKQPTMEDSFRSKNKTRCYVSFCEHYAEGILITIFINNNIHSYS